MRCRERLAPIVSYQSAIIPPNKHTSTLDIKIRKNPLEHHRAFSSIQRQLQAMVRCVSRYDRECIIECFAEEGIDLDNGQKVLGMNWRVASLPHAANACKCVHLMIRIRTTLCNKRTDRNRQAVLLSAAHSDVEDIV